LAESWQRILRWTCYACIMGGRSGRQTFRPFVLGVCNVNLQEVVKAEIERLVQEEERVNKEHERIAKEIEQRKREMQERRRRRRLL